MAQANYQLAVYDPNTGQLLDLVTQERWFDFQYTLALNDVGEFRITVPTTDYLTELRTVTDLIIDVYRAFESVTFVYEGSYLCRYSDIGIVDEGGREVVIIAGFHANHLLKRRKCIVNDDPIGVGGFITRSGRADVVMSDFVRYQTIDPQVNTDRIYPNFSLMPLGMEVFFDTYQRRQDTDTLLTVLQEIANQQRDPQWIDFEVIHVNGNAFQFQPKRIGSDKSYTNDPANFVLFDPLRGTLKMPRLRYDRKNEVNSVWVGGQGYISDRVYINTDDSNSVDDSPFNRIEDSIDARQSTTLDELTAAGDSYINENRAKILFDFELIEGSSQMNYGTDWTLGDIVTASYLGYGENHRITSVTIRTEAAKEVISIKTLFWSLANIPISTGYYLADSVGMLLADSEDYLMVASDYGGV